MKIEEIENMSIQVPKRIEGALMNSLKGGVVPRVGLRIHCSRKGARNKLLKMGELHFVF